MKAKIEDISEEEQLALWVRGESVHIRDGDCLPDFSCCRPPLKAPEEFRLRYLNAGSEEREAMCVELFLTAMLQDLGCTVVR